MILDVFYEIFIWEGTTASATEKKMADLVVKEYIEVANDGRSQELPVTKVIAGKESLMFKCHFHGWTNTKVFFFLIVLIPFRCFMIPMINKRENEINKYFCNQNQPLLVN